MRCRFCHHPLTEDYWTHCPACGCGFDPQDEDVDFWHDPRWLTPVLAITIIPVAWVLVIRAFGPTRNPWLGYMLIAPLLALIIVNCFGTRGMATQPRWFERGRRVRIGSRIGTVQSSFDNGLHYVYVDSEKRIVAATAGWLAPVEPPTSATPMPQR